MYGAWTLINLGVALVVKSAYVVVPLLSVVLIAHFLVIRGEEETLEKHFGEAFRRRRTQVRRYL